MSRTPARVALYGAPTPGNGDAPTRLADTAPEALVLHRVSVPMQSECPACLALLVEGDLFALALADGPWCVAPWTHARA